jgi:hypothetical protein
VERLIERVQQKRLEIPRPAPGVAKWPVAGEDTPIGNWRTTTRSAGEGLQPKIG